MMGRFKRKGLRKSGIRYSSLEIAAMKKMFRKNNSPFLRKEKKFDKTVKFYFGKRLK